MPAAWLLSARAQQAERVLRMGTISGANDQLTQARIAAFFRELQQLGWTEGRSVHIDARWSAGNAAEIRRYAAEFVALAPDVILTAGSSSMGPLLEATRAVPIVFAIVPDPVASSTPTAGIAHPSYCANLALAVNWKVGEPRLAFFRSGVRRLIMSTLPR